MPKVVDHEAYRSELADGAFALFARHGYEALSMREVAAGLSVSTGTLYHYFSSKENLFRQTIQQLTARDVAEALGQLPSGEDSAERTQRLFAFVSEREAYFQDLLLVVLDYSRQVSPETLRADLGPFVERYVAAISEFTGMQDPGQCSTLLAQIIGMLVLHRLGTAQPLAEPAAVGLEDGAPSPAGKPKKG